MLGLCIFYIITAPAVWAQGWQDISQVELLSVKEAGTALEIIDVRTPEEFASGHVPGAINIPLDDLSAHLPKLASLKDQPVVVYCRSGRRAGVALERLAQEGFSQLRHLDGDMLGWQENDLPMEK
ncbi:MAG: rhodanese-like domain-containing protein [Hahellaceae bacterium]|nr:rhodanese-like domain-containing protein [Hahellaceae bacterium]MCP5209888.1 rhodanese-like domain-containing protein [Hahellaceae bacterium]